MEQTIADNTTENTFQTDKVSTIVGAHFVHDFYSAFLAPLLPTIKEALSLNLAQTGALSAFLQYPALINPILGYFADRANLKYLVIFAPAVTGTFMSLMGYTQTYFALAILLLVVGFSSAAFHSSGPPMLTTVSGKFIGRGMSLWMAAGELGRTLGPILVTWIVASFSFKGLLPVAVFGWLASILLFWRLRDVQKPLSATHANNLKEVLPRIIRLMIPIVVFVFFRNFINVSLVTFLPTFMSEQGRALLESGSLLSVLEAAGVAGALLTGTISDKIGRRRVLAFCVTGAALFLYLFMITDQQLLIPTLLILGFFALSTNPVLMSIVQDNFPDNRALANGVYMFSTFLIRPLQAIMIGSMGDTFGGLGNAFLISAGLGILALPALFFIPKRQKLEEISA